MTDAEDFDGYDVSDFCPDCGAELNEFCQCPKCDVDGDIVNGGLGSFLP